MQLCFAAVRRSAVADPTRVLPLVSAIEVTRRQLRFVPTYKERVEDGAFAVARYQTIARPRLQVVIKVAGGPFAGRVRSLFTVGEGGLHRNRVDGQVLIASGDLVAVIGVSGGLPPEERHRLAEALGRVALPRLPPAP